MLLGCLVPYAAPYTSAVVLQVRAQAQAVAQKTQAITNQDSFQLVGAILQPLLSACCHAAC